MRTLKDCITVADYTNLLISKVIPWYKVKVKSVTATNILLEIGTMKACGIAKGPDWMLSLHDSGSYADTKELMMADNLLSHINAIMCGATRDDHGRLHGPKEMQNAN